MSFEPLNIPGLSDDEMRTVNRLLEQLDAKAERNLLRLSYYDGKRAARQIGSVIPPQYYRTGIVLGWSAKSVDMLGRRCNLDSFVWPDGDLDSLGYRDLLDGNHLMSRINSAKNASLINGVSFLVNTRGDTSKGEPASLIHVKDALNATGTWNARKGALDDLFSVTSRDDDGKVNGLVLYLDGLTVTAEREKRTWSVDHTEHPWGVPAEPVVYKPSEVRPFGMSRISRPIMSIHDRALREVVRLEGHMDVFSMPQFVLLGASEEIFKNADGSQKAVWQVMLGRIKGVEDNPEKPDALARVDVKQFPAASPAPHGDALDILSRAFAREASLPDSAVALKGVSNPTSADSYDASQYELIAEAEGAMRDWSSPITRAVARSLAILNGDSGVRDEFLSIRPDWLGAKFESRAAKADAGSKQVAAAPWLAETEVGLELMGLEPEQIKRALAEKRKAAGRAVLATLAQPQTPQANADGA